MSERGLPPYPMTGDWKAWAIQLVEFLSVQGRSEEFMAPRAVPLMHQLPNEVYRAVDAGVLMFDPLTGQPVVSVGGVWVQLSLSNTFLGLTDSPSVYTGDAGNLVAVNSAENAVEFIRNGESHDATGVSSWRIIGTTLECWGIAAATNPISVTFGKVFANATYAYNVSVSSSANAISLGTTNRTTTGMDINRWDSSTNANVTNQISWHVIGEWDGVS